MILFCFCMIFKNLFIFWGLLKLVRVAWSIISTTFFISRRFSEKYWLRNWVNLLNLILILFIFLVFGVDWEVFVCWGGLVVVSARGARETIGIFLVEFLDSLFLELLFLDLLFLDLLLLLLKKLLKFNFLFKLFLYWFVLLKTFRNSCKYGIIEFSYISLFFNVCIFFFNVDVGYDMMYLLIVDFVLN